MRPCLSSAVKVQVHATFYSQTMSSWFSTLPNANLIMSSLSGRWIENRGFQRGKGKCYTQHEATFCFSFKRNSCIISVSYLLDHVFFKVVAFYGFIIILISFVTVVSAKICNTKFWCYQCGHSDSQARRPLYFARSGQLWGNTLLRLYVTCDGAVLGGWGGWGVLLISLVLRDGIGKMFTHLLENHPYCFLQVVKNKIWMKMKIYIKITEYYCTILYLQHIWASPYKKVIFIK